MTDGDTKPEVLRIENKLQLACDMVRHEDNLVNMRTTWALVFQGFLFTAYPAIADLQGKFCRQWSLDPVAVALWVLSWLGVASGIAAWAGVRTAEQQTRRVMAWWLREHEAAGKPNLPPLYEPRKRRLRASSYFIVMAVAWVCLALFPISLSGLHAGGSPGCGGQKGSSTKESKQAAGR